MGMRESPPNHSTGFTDLCFVLQRRACKEEAVLVGDGAQVLEQAGCGVLQSMRLVDNHHLEGMEEREGGRECEGGVRTGSRDRRGREERKKGEG